MRTVEQLIAELKMYAPDSYCYAYEGEVEGVVIVDNTHYKRLGFIPCPELDHNQGNGSRVH